MEIEVILICYRQIQVFHITIKLTTERCSTAEYFFILIHFTRGEVLNISEDEDVFLTSTERSPTHLAVAER